MSDTCPKVEACCDNSIYNYSLTTNCSLPVEYFNTEQTANCPDGTVGTPYTTPENTFSSFISQEDANNKALTYAIEQLTCTPVVICEPCGGDDPQSFIDTYRFPQEESGSLPISWNGSDLSQFTEAGGWILGNDGVYDYVQSSEGVGWNSCGDANLLIFNGIIRKNFKLTLDYFDIDGQHKNRIGIYQTLNISELIPSNCFDCGSPLDYYYPFDFGEWTNNRGFYAVYQLSAYNNCIGNCENLFLDGYTPPLTGSIGVWTTRIYIKDENGIRVQEPDSGYDSGYMKSCGMDYIGGYISIVSNNTMRYKNITLEDA